MKAEKKRFTLDLVAAFLRRFKVITALKGLSVRQYCLAGVDRGLAIDEAERAKSLPFGDEALDRCVAPERGS